MISGGTTIVVRLISRLDHPGTASPASQRSNLIEQTL